MPILSKAEIEELKRIHPRKKVVRLLFLFIGTGISILGLLFLLFEIDLGLIIDSVNFSLLIDILIILIGLILASKYFIAPYFLRENSITIKKAHELREPSIKHIRFFSFAITRLIAASILILIGLISLLTFGTEIGHEVEYGSAVVLGGPSFFYLTGLPMLGVGFSLLLYFMLSIFRGRFSASENFYFFYEIRPGFPWLTEIPKKDIEAIRYQNNHLGPKLAWVVFFVPFIVLQLMTAIPLFFVEKAGPEFVLSWSFLIYSILEIVVLMILVFFQQNYFEIVTPDRLYEMWFSPLKLRGQKLLKGEFKELFNSSQINPENKSLREINSDNSFNEGKLFSSINKTHIHLYQLIFGLLLIIFSIIMLTNMILFGPFVWWIAITYGIILIVRFFNQDLNDSMGYDLSYIHDQKIFTLSREFRFKFQFVQLKNVESLEITKWYRKLDFFDIMALTGLVVFLTIQQFQGWALADTFNLVIDNIFSSMLMSIILIFIFLFLCIPMDVIELKTPTIKYRIQISLKNEQKPFMEILKSFYSRNFKAMSKREMKRVFLIRSGLIILIILSVSIYMTFYFAYFF